MRNIIESLIAADIHELAEMSVTDINFKQEVVAACEQNYCGRYGKSWYCPPGVGELGELKAKYTKYARAVVFTTKSELEDSFDIEGMDSAREAHQAITSRLLGLKEEYDIEILGAGSCNLCKTCTYPDKACRHPERAFPAVEAVGIDVVAIASTCNINYHNGENSVTYFSVVLY